MMMNQSTRLVQAMTMFSNSRKTNSKGLTSELMKEMKTNKTLEGSRS